MKVTRRFEFDAAHRLMGYDGSCSNIHGHHYVAEVTVASLASGLEALDDLGMLIDFKELKSIGDWIDVHWDHALLLNPGDNLDIPTKITRMASGNPIAENMAKVLCDVVEITQLPSGNPTAENMAKILYDVADSIIPPGVVVSNIRLYETPDCFVDFDGR